MGLSTNPVPVLVFAKPPRAGLVKTRLAQHLGAERAAQLAGAFLADTLARLNHWGRCPVWLVGAGDESEFESYLGPGVRFLTQGQGSLGERLARALDRARDTHGTGAVAVGADTPHLPMAMLEETLAELTRGRVVLGPARDGGFYLLGVPGAAELAPRMRRVLTVEHAWGTPSVLASMRRALSAAHVACHDLETFWDIDEVSDLVQLQGRQPAASDPGWVRTAGLLASLPGLDPGAGT